jgi:ABC-2 type transport system ATP-binding protein
MIEVEHVDKLYGSFSAVRDVSFQVGNNEIVGLLGPNGAGKTTIMKILTCYHFPSSGRVQLNGFDIYENALEVKRSVGYLPENAPVYGDLTVLEYLGFIADVRYPGRESPKNARLDWAIEECGLGSVANRSISTLSKGFRQRTGLAQAILHDPSILILDEPTSGLDPNQIAEIRKLIRRLGSEKTVILSTHILQEVEAVCDRVLILNEGRIVAEGTTEEIGREMKGDDIIGVELKIPRPTSGGGTTTSIAEELRDIPGVNRVINAESGRSDGVVSVQLSMKASPDNGEKVFDWAVSRGYKILAMTPQRVSLEEIFARVTTTRPDTKEIAGE